MYDNPLGPPSTAEPSVETEVLAGEIVGKPRIESVDGVREAHFDLLVQHPSHEISGRIPIVCRGDAVERVRRLGSGSRVTVAGIRAFDDERKPPEFVLCEYLKVSSVVPQSIVD